MNINGMPLWAWIVFYALVLIMLVADLKMFGRKGEHEVNVNEYINSLTSVMGFRLNVPHIEVPTSVSLAVIFGVLLLSMLFSVVVTHNKGTTPNIK